MQLGQDQTADDLSCWNFFDKFASEGMNFNTESMGPNTPSGPGRLWPVNLNPLGPIR
jgi:hypothetical protein